MTSKCKIIKYKLNANIFFQIYFKKSFLLPYHFLNNKKQYIEKLES